MRQGLHTDAGDHQLLLHHCKDTIDVCPRSGLMFSAIVAILNRFRQCCVG